MTAKSFPSIAELAGPGKAPVADTPVADSPVADSPVAEATRSGDALKGRVSTTGDLGHALRPGLRDVPPGRWLNLREAAPDDWANDYPAPPAASAVGRGS